MFERFSSGYYLGELYVEPHEEDRAAIHSADHERMNEQLYAIGEGVERLDAPLVMKLDATHFPVHGDDSVPSGTLAVPDSWTIDRLPTRREVLLAEGSRAMELLRYSGWRSSRGT
ncbi:MAG: DUF5802 family protein [Halobacteriota archaeon]